MRMIVKRVEQIQIKHGHSLFNYCDGLSFASKNLYNYANYIIRQEFINNSKWIRYNELNKMLKTHETYKALPAQTSQQTLRLLDKNWKSSIKSIKKWSKNREAYLGRPKLPKYKKKSGRNIVAFTYQQCKIANEYITFQKTDLMLKTSIKDNLKQVRIIPKGSIYLVEVVYEKEITAAPKPIKNIAGIDLGLDNFATLTNNIGVKPIVINGKNVKSINQYFNKRKAELMSYVQNRGISNRIKKLTLKRNNKINNFLHKSSRYIINWCIVKEIDTIVVGNNKNWKQEINLGKRTNQHFIGIPYEIFIKQLKYKCEETGINFILTEESYTSKASFIDMDEVPVYKKDEENMHFFSGKRIKRGLYRSLNSILINADVNGSYNIIRKVFPEAFANGIEGVGLHPVRLNIA